MDKKEVRQLHFSLPDKDCKNFSTRKCITEIEDYYKHEHDIMDSINTCLEEQKIEHLKLLAKHASELNDLEMQHRDDLEENCLSLFCFFDNTEYTME